MTMINVGIIGCGKIAQVRHIPEYMANPHARLAGLFDLNLQRAEQLAAQFGSRAYASIEELLADPQIQAVSVCTANHSHAEISIAALQAGKHVLCEKPMATTLQECEDMVAAARQAGRYLMLGHNQRLTPAHITARELIEKGMIGEVVSFRTTFGHSGPETWSVDSGQSVWFFDRAKAAMGVMADLGIHKTDLIHFLTGDTIVETTARLVTVDKRDSSGELIGVDDNALCIYRLRGGAVGNLTASWTYYGAEDNSTVIYGTKGILRIYDDPHYAIKVVTREGHKMFYEMDMIQTNDKQTTSGVIDAFVDCLVNDHAPEISGEEGLKTMRVIFANIESSLSGCCVTIEQG